MVSVQFYAPNEETSGPGSRVSEQRVADLSTTQDAAKLQLLRAHPGRQRETVALNLGEAFGMELSSRAGDIVVHGLTVGGQAERSGLKVGSQIANISGQIFVFFLITNSTETQRHFCKLGVDVSGLHDVRREVDACKNKGDRVVSVQFYSSDRLGLDAQKELRTLNLTEALGMGVSNDAGCVVVYYLTLGGQAERAGIQVGSRLISINGALTLI